MAKAELSELRLAYKKAVDDWVQAIRAEEALATTDHSMTAMELWDEAHFKEDDARAESDRSARGLQKTHFETLTTGYDRLHLSAGFADRNSGVLLFLPIGKGCSAVRPMQVEASGLQTVRYQNALSSSRVRQPALHQET
jgi:hypothetical protein